MTQRLAVRLQQGIWIDKQRLADAGLQDPLEITVQSGEIRIRSAAFSEPVESEATWDVEGVYPLIDESFRDGWEGPGMQDYDRYEDFRKQ